MTDDPLRKSVIRHRMTQTRTALAPDERMKANRVIQDEVHKHWNERWRTVLIYVNLADEVATVPLLLELMETGKRLCVPAFDAAAKTYYPSELKDFGTEMASGHMGILEPLPAARRPVRPDELDVIFVPGLAFDRLGNRVGYGYGYFDRITRDTRAVKIGLAYHFQLAPTVPAHENDVPVDCIITEKEFIQCPTR